MLGGTKDIISHPVQNMRFANMSTRLSHKLGTCVSIIMRPSSYFVGANLAPEKYELEALL